MHPIKRVMISWLILPTIVMEIVFNLFPSSMYNTRPRYSPTRLGVLTENETPDSTALNALKKLTFCIFFTDIFHLIASMDQLTNIRTITATRFQSKEL